MPLPLLFIIPAVVTALTGAGKTIKAVLDNKEANDVNAQANAKIDNAKRSLENARSKSYHALKHLGLKKLRIFDDSIMRFVKSFEKLHHVTIEKTKGLEEIEKIRIDKQSLQEMKVMGKYAATILSGTVKGTLGGALAAFGAYSGVVAFGSASTGAAITTLGGAAATNATLAFLGGGTLAAGGLGIAGGTAILGGIVAGPALMIMGFIVGAKASTNLDNARGNLAQAKKIAEEMNTGTLLCNGITSRSELFVHILESLDKLFIISIEKLETIIQKKGADFRKYHEDEKKVVAISSALAKVIKSVLDTPILNDDGSLTTDSEQVAIDAEKYLNSPSSL